MAISRSEEALREAYDALELETGATVEEVKAAYLDLVKVWHPDRYSQESDRLKRRAEEKLKQINEAYERLRGASLPRSAGGGGPLDALMLTPMDFGDRWGYVDGTGQPAIYPEFAAARPFAEGMAAVKPVSYTHLTLPTNREV